MTTAAQRPHLFRLLLGYTISLLIGLSFSGCDYPYQPQRMSDPYQKDTTNIRSVFSGSGVVYGVNGVQQTCNPSIAPTGPFSGCMLFLGYDNLGVRVPDSLSAFEDIEVQTHDRLIIVDTSNTVRWYILNTGFGGNRDLQCPEWSPNEDYIICLYGTVGNPYKAFAVRIANKSVFPLTGLILEEFSTPHLWVDSVWTDSARTSDIAYSSDSIASVNDIKVFFGTAAVKLIYTLPSANGTLHYVDYTNDSTPRPQPLRKPEGRENWQCASPLISPDGNWVTYHCCSNPTFGTYYASYIQRLSPEAEPILIAEDASDPHWWVDPISDVYYLIYTATFGEYFSSYDFTDTIVTSGRLAGCTLKQPLSGTWKQVPSHIGSLALPDNIPPDTLIHLPFKGGLSRDGFFLGTAYKYAYIAWLHDE